MKKNFLTILLSCTFCNFVFAQSKQKPNSQESRIQSLERELNQLKAQNNKPHEQQVVFKLIEYSCGWLNGSSKGENCEAIKNYIFQITNKFGEKIDFALTLRPWYYERYANFNWIKNGGWSESNGCNSNVFKDGITIREIITKMYYGKCGDVAKYHSVVESSLGFRIENETSTPIDTKIYKPSSD